MATKKQDVADSWEEIDEERLSGTISILKNTSNSTGSSTAKSNGKASTSGSAARQQESWPQMLDEELRPKMVARPMQILKRPQPAGGTDGKGPADTKPKTQIKSLDQRKQEYAEARLRILGSAHDDEEAETKKGTPTTAANTAATNGHRINNSNNNNNNNNNHVNGVGGASAAAGGGVVGSTANSNANNAYRYHSPYRQQAPIGTFPPALQNAPPPAQSAAGMYYPSMGNQNQHHPMHSAHPLHHPPGAFPHVPQHHHLQHNNHPYQHQQHFAQHINSPSGNQHMYVGRNGGNGVPGGSGYFPKGGIHSPYAEPNGIPLLGHAPPGVHPNHSIPYGNGGGVAGGYAQANSHGNLAGHAGANIGNNQNVLRMPAGPDGSQGFSMRR